MLKYRYGNAILLQGRLNCASPCLPRGAPPSHARPPFAGAVPESRRAAAHGTQEVGEQLSELISVHSTNNHPFPCGPHPPSAAAGPIMQCNNHSTSRRASSKGAVCLSAGTKTVAAPFAPRTPSAWPVSVWPTALVGEERVVSGGREAGSLKVCGSERNSGCGGCQELR